MKYKEYSMASKTYLVRSLRKNGSVEWSEDGLTRYKAFKLINDTITENDKIDQWHLTKQTIILDIVAK